MAELPAVMSMAEFSRSHNVTKGCVSAWLRRGYVSLVDGKVDVVESNRRLASRPDVHRGGRAKVRPGKRSEPPGSPPVSYSGGSATLVPGAEWSLHEATRQERIAGAKLKQLQLAREAGLVTDNAEVADKVGKRFNIVRSRMLALPTALAPRLAVLNSAEECGRLLDEAIRAALTELSSI